MATAVSMENDFYEGSTNDISNSSENRVNTGDRDRCRAAAASYTLTVINQAVQNISDGSNWSSGGIANNADGEADERHAIWNSDCERRGGKTNYSSLMTVQYKVAGASVEQEPILERDQLDRKDRG